MLTSIILVILGIALFAYVALPLLLPGGADPLPPERDPVALDLEEEKAALFRAIRELDAREDLSQARREQLRARYEAKAARVLRAIDERATADSAPPAPRRGGQRVPLGALSLLAIAVVIATTLGAYVLPRVGENSTVTTFFRDDLDAARELRDLQRAAEREPSAPNLLALADGYWRAQDAAAALETYRAAVEEAGASSALAFRRLGYLTLQADLDEAATYFEQARRLEPNDLDTLYALGEIRLAQGDPAAAAESWRSYLEVANGDGEAEVRARLELAEELLPLVERVEADPSRENLAALADTYWRHDERERAVELYFRILTEYDPNDPVALGRTGQLLFVSGRNDDAIALMERAARSPEVDAQTLLFLGNAYFSAERYGDAIEVWERHIALVGEESAGRVPALIEDARARLAAEPGAERESPTDATGGEAPETGGAAPEATRGSGAPTPAESADNGAATGGAAPGSGEASIDGALVFAANCASCHGSDGSGGAGPRLAGNSRAANEQNVSNAVRFGRSMMPGFAAVLEPAELEAVVEYVVGTLSAGGAR